MGRDLIIFLADDDPDDRNFFRAAVNELQQQSKLEMAYDGEMFLNMLRISNVLPDLIVLDINMPKKNGIQCLQEIRAVKKYDLIPVIIFSTSAEESIVDIAYENGASYYIQKPDNFQEIKEVVRFCVEVQSLNIERTKENFLITNIWSLK